MIASVASFIFVLVVLSIPTYGLYRKLDIMDIFALGAKDGMATILRMLPFIVGIFTSIRMLRASGFFDSIGYCLGPVFKAIGIPVELLPLILMRPFSGAASNALLVDLLKDQGGNSMVGMMAATIMGSTETTFYVVSFYFAAVSVRKIKYALWTSLMADVAGMMAAAYIVPKLFS